VSGPGDEDEVWRHAGRYPGWLWLSGSSRSVARRTGFDSLVRRSCGVIVESDEDRVTVRLALRARAAEPPVIVAGDGREVAGLLSGLALGAAGAGSGAPRALP
jgi:hypothetical protein